MAFAASTVPLLARVTRRIQRALIGAVAALVCLLWTVAPAGAATADRITWAVQPAVAEGQQQRVSFRYDLEPGGTVTDSVTVTNFSDTPVEFQVYASDGVITADGQFDLLPAATAPKDVGTWITVSAASVTVPAQSSTSVPFTIAVPANATPGDHPGGIVAALTRAGADGQSQVSVENRVGARVHLRVGGEVSPQLSVTGMNVDYRGAWNPFKPGSAQVTYTLQNTGNVRLGSDQTTRIRGLFGIPIASHASDPVPELLPGSQVTMKDTIDGVWPLFRISATAGGDAFTVGSDVVDAPPSVTDGVDHAWAMPWGQLILLALVLALAWALIVRRRRAKAKLADALDKARQEGAAAAQELQQGSE